MQIQNAKYNNKSINQFHYSTYYDINVFKSLKSNSLKTNISFQVEFTYRWHEEILPTYWCTAMTEARKRPDIWLSSLKQYRKKLWCKNWWAYFIFRGKNVNAMECPFFYLDKMESALCFIWYASFLPLSNCFLLSSNYL